MSPCPDVLTHNYHPDHGPFGNLCDLLPAQAAALFRDVRGMRPVYPARRFAVEDWLIAGSRRLIGGIRLARPRYLFLGDFADGRDPHRPASIVVPLASIPAESLTFTYPDSMTSYLLATRPDLAAQRRDFHGKIFTLQGIKELVGQIGWPEPRWPRPPGAASDGFVEAQLWDDAPVRDAIEAHARGRSMSSS